MTLVGQPPPSPALQQAYQLFAEGKTLEAEDAVRRPAVEAKRAHGSGSHPLALAYADMARFHLRAGDAEKAAKEFQHAASGPMPAEAERRKDRLAMLFGVGAALAEAGHAAEAEQVLRGCRPLAKKLYGDRSALAAVSLVPIADTLLAQGKTADAARLAAEAYDTLWKLGDPLFACTVGTRAETLKAAGKPGNPFDELSDLPDELVSAAVAATLTRAGKGDSARVRAVLADVLAFADKKFGDGHTVTCDALAAVAHHEAAAGDAADERVRRTAVRRSVWSFAVRRVPGGLLANLEVGFEPNGGIHLAPHLTRDPDPAESAQLETILNQAVDDLFARPAARP